MAMMYVKEDFVVKCSWTNCLECCTWKFLMYYNRI